MNITIEISPGELVDKLTILEIKLENITDTKKLSNIQREYDLLTAALKANLAQTADLVVLIGDLKNTNQDIWKLEDDIRDHERDGNFGDSFVKLARSVYRTNDKRAAIKRKINDLLKSEIVEEKSYSEY
jgi:hypothetical protein